MKPRTMPTPSGIPRFPPRVAGLILLLLFSLSAANPAQKKRKKAPVLKGGSDVVLPVEVEGGEGMEFHLHLPSGWKAKSKKRRYPILLVLHGNGQAPTGAFRKYRQLSKKKTPLIVIAPKYQKEKRFNAERWPQDVCMKAFEWLRKQAMDHYNGDRDGFFVQGFSMGGSYASLYVTYLIKQWQLAEHFPVRGVILNSGVAYSRTMKWPENVPSLFVVGELETAVRGTINVVESMQRAANEFHRQGGDVRFHLIPGMKHTVNQECLDIAQRLIFEECRRSAGIDKDIAAFKKRLKKNPRRLTDFLQIERLAAALPKGSRADRINKSVVQLSDHPLMVREREAWKLLAEARKADRPDNPDRKKAYAALARSHPKTEAGRIAKDRVAWID